MKSALAVLGLLLMMPMFAAAESEYSACIKMESVMRRSALNILAPGTGIGRGMPAAAMPRFVLPISIDWGYHSIAQYDTRAMWGIRSSTWSWSQNVRALALSRACRHLVRSEPPAYRVVAVKSPAMRTTRNITDRKAGKPGTSRGSTSRR